MTPEIVRPIPRGERPPDLKFPKPVKLQGTAEDAPQTPGMNITGAVPVKPERETVPVEQLIELRKAGQQPAPQTPAVQFVPVPVAPGVEQPPNPGLQAAPPAPPGK